MSIESPPIFAIVPVEAIKDKRLTLEQLRVLVALFSFRGKNTNTVYPRREAIAERTGMHTANISSATSALERLGWLTKEGKGGHSKATRYTITVPETVADSATVAEQATVAQSATGTLAESATRLPLAESATRKELTNELTNRTLFPASPEIPACPVQEIIDLYHTNMPLNPKVKILNKVRRSAISARWREASKMSCAPFADGYSAREDGLAAWREFFEICAESQFLTGRATSMPGKPPFVATIDFLVSPSGFVKCLENKYHREAA